MMRRIIFLTFLCLFITACSQQKDTLYYAKNPRKLGLILSGCQMMGLTSVSHPRCIRAKQIYYQLIDLSNQMASNPEKFGKVIIAKQIMLEKVKEQLKKANHEASEDQLKKKYQFLKKEIDLRLFFAAKSEGME